MDMLGDTVQITPVNGTARPLQGRFIKNYIDVQDMAGFELQFECMQAHSADISRGAIIEFENGRYLVQEIKPDSNGMVALVLQYDS